MGMGGNGNHGRSLWEWDDRIQARPFAVPRTLKYPLEKPKSCKYFIVVEIFECPSLAIISIVGMV